MKTTIEWHSVKEMLPERKGLADDENEYVLVAVGSEITIAGYGKDGFDHYDNFGFFNLKNFTHWAYLPEPPKEA